MAKKKFERPFNTFKGKDFIGLLNFTCAKLNINHDILKPKNEIKPPTADKPPTTQIKPPTAEIKPPTTEFKPPTTEFKPPTADKPPTTQIKPPTVAIIDTKKLFGENANEFFKNSLAAFILENQKFQYRKTGFSNIDEFSNFLPGIYVLGGLPALGKTTFALQLSNQLAHSGETCILCSFEMSAGYLYSKLLAQEINFINCKGIEPDGTFGKTPTKFIKASDIIFGNFKYHEPL